MKRYTKSLNTDLFLNAATKLNLKVKVINETASLVRIYNDNKKVNIIENNTGFNDAVSRRVARNKYLSLAVLRNEGISVPSNIKFKLKGDLNLVAKDIFAATKNFNLHVLKANNLSLGKGIYFNLKSEEEILVALTKIYKLNCRTVLLEEFVAGENYRVLVYKNQILGILKRIPGNIVGDGNSTIEELIHSKNINRAEIGEKPIKIDTILEKKLSEEGLTQNSILEIGKKFTFREVSNLAQGGDIENIDIDLIPEVTREFFINARKASLLEFAGIDYISSDITFKGINGKINEINACPMIDIHYYSALRDKRDLLEVPTKILQMYFYE